MKKLKDLLSIDTNAKTVKGTILGYVTGILYLAPWKVATGVKNVCAHASKGCAKACLYSAGRGKFSNVQLARINKTLLFFEERDYFLKSLFNQLSKLYRKYGNNLVIRLNGTSDIPFQNLKINFEDRYYNNIFEAFPSIQFYDYTKDVNKVLSNNLPNYHLTFSVDERDVSKDRAKEALKHNKNIALVVTTKLYKELFNNDNKPYLVSNEGNKVNLINGDINDLRFLDSFGIVVLKAKGDANKDKTGFVYNNLKDILKLVNN